MPSSHPLDLAGLRVLPLEQRSSLTRVEDILVPIDRVPAPVVPPVDGWIRAAADGIRAARARDAQVILMYGAHLLRNGAALLLTDLMERGWITHLATNGAGTIHDWEYAWLGRSTESVEKNVATGTFGTWDETGRNIHLALMAGALQGLGYGASLGQFILDDGCTLPDPDQLRTLLSGFAGDPLGGAVADLLSAMRRHGLAPGRHVVGHRWKHASLLAQARRLGVPVTVHPGIGYDIISCHPMFDGAVIGRAAGDDFRRFAGAVDGLDGGVVLSVGSAIMAPQVFEKSLSCVHNLRFQAGRPAVSGHSIHVVDLQDGGNWDWSKGEPPKTNPAYYLRFCKSFSRMGGAMQYLQCDNLAFVQHLHRALVAA
ncbi:MAG: hypothetical protein DVB31_08485 [Verrucomicrobia bacterium]|nr:MAG: hypothetical protein DVB31_08485 [Verrucomicrobiota bacterium]